MIWLLVYIIFFMEVRISYPLCIIRYRVYIKYIFYIFSMINVQNMIPFIHKCFHQRQTYGSSNVVGCTGKEGYLYSSKRFVEFNCCSFPQVPYTTLPIAHWRFKKKNLFIIFSFLKLITIEWSLHKSYCILLNMYTN